MIDSSVDYKNLPRPTWAEIDIDAILNNINEYKKALGDKVEIIVAAKGNGYGHGMLPIVKAINELDIYGFATGNMYEAIEMRKHGIDKPIQLFAHNFPETADLLVKYDLMPSFVKPGDAKSFADALGKDVALKVWVKCDTGLGRLGLLPEEVLPELEYIRNETSFKIEGLYSHIGPTDSDKNPKKDEYNEGQISCFNKIIADIEAAGFEIPRYQLASTYATQRYFKSEKAKKRMAVVKYAVSMVIAIVATAWAFQFVSWSFELWPTTPIYKLPLALSRLSIIISFILMSIYVLIHLIRSVAILKGGEN